jgi:type I restriction enzyme S subunit
MALNQDLRAVHPHVEIAPRYLAYFLRSAAQSILHECSKDGTTVDSIEAGRLMQVPVPLPILREKQEAIASRIDALFTEIDEGEAALADARAGVEIYRKSLLKAAVTGELTADWRRDNPPQETGEQLLQRILTDRRTRWQANPKYARKRYAEPVGPHTDGLPELPEGWTWASLDQLAWSAQYGTSQKCGYLGPGEPVLRIPNLRDGLIDLDDMKRSLLRLDLPPGEHVSPGDLLIVRTNGSEELIGRAGMTLERLNEPTYFASYLIRYRLTGDRARWRWIRAFTESSVFRDQVLSSIGSSAGQYNLSMGKLDSFPVALPPSGEIDAALGLRLNHIQKATMAAMAAAETKLAASLS